MRSIPEKTLEHWCSIHLTYRYRARLRMWWPTAGEDIDVSGGPLVPGKRFWLELKTTEWKKTAKRHDLSIDLDQLAAYGTHPVPDFYVFPTPPWSGILGQAPKPTWAGRLDPSDFAYQTHSGDKWFPNWLYVVPGATLRRIVSRLPAKTPRKPNAPKGKHKKTPKPKNSLRIAEISGDKLTWLIPPPPPGEFLLWHDFWKKMESCGDSGSFAAQFILPVDTSGLVSPPPPTTHDENHLPPVPGPTPPMSTRGPDARATTTWIALKSAVSELKAAPKELADDTERTVAPELGSANSGDLMLWSPVDELFVGSKPSHSSGTVDNFVWGPGVGRGMVLLTLEALRL